LHALSVHSEIASIVTAAAAVNCPKSNATIQEDDSSGQITFSRADPAVLTDVVVVCVAIGVWLALGYPVARKLGPSVIWPALAAPPLGIAILSVLTVVLYAWGIRLETAFKIGIGFAILGIVLALRDGLRSRFNRLHGAFLITLVLAMLLVLLPKWLGPSEFPVFQANFVDQFNYLTIAWSASQYDYPTIRNMDFDTETAIGVERIAFLIELRPGVPLMLGGLASTLDQSVLVASYAYLAALQLCMFFASVFVLRNVVALSGGLSIFIALGVTVGFSLQHAFDVNAWSAFASLSLVMLYTGLLIMGLATNGAGKANQMPSGVLGYGEFFRSMFVCVADDDRFLYSASGFSRVRALEIGRYGGLVPTLPFRL
jgi:hypothetical protein